VITFGLFSLVVNAVVVSVADYFVEGMVIDGFGWTLAFSICLSILTSILSIDED
jgi:putative membrane protein